MELELESPSRRLAPPSCHPVLSNIDSVSLILGHLGCLQNVARCRAVCNTWNSAGKNIWQDSLRSYCSGAVTCYFDWGRILSILSLRHQEWKDSLDHQGTTTNFKVITSFEDLVFAAVDGGRYCVFSTLIPGPWKVLPLGSKLDVAHISVARLNPQTAGSSSSELLLVVVDSEAAVLRFFPREGMWRYTTGKPEPLPVGRSVWFEGELYARAEFLMGYTSDEEEMDAKVLARFNMENNDWEEVQMSSRDQGILRSGHFHLLLIQGRLLVFLLPFYSDDFKVFQLLDYDRHASRKRKNKKTKKRLVDVTGEFSKALELATKQKPIHVFNNDGDDESGSFFWVTSEGLVFGYSMSTNGVFLAGTKPLPSIRSFKRKFFNSIHIVELLHHTNVIPPGEQSLMLSHFSGWEDLSLSPDVAAGKKNKSIK